MEHDYKAGQLVYIIIRNPHAQDVAHVQQAAIVQHPENPNELVLFSHEHYYPLSNEMAIFPTEYEAEAAYQEAFGTNDTGELHG